MLDHILGRPSAKLRRSQIFLVLFFWVWRLYRGDGASRRLPSPTASSFIPSSSRGLGGRVTARASNSWLWRAWVKLVGRRMVFFMGKVNQRLQNFTPYQLILATLTVVYAVRHFDDLLGISAPEPLARLYSRSYYRATYVNTAFDAGFSMAMNIKPKWIKDICSILFSAYYLVYAREGDEVLRRFRAVCSVEMLRTTWEKTKNPYVRLLTSHHRPKLNIIRKININRPPRSSRSNLPPVKTMLFFSGAESQLAAATELIVDFPGGGFIAMGPECHEERLRTWAKRTGKPVLGVDYGKAPEYPYPWAIEEGFDAYRTLMETKGEVIGIKSGQLDIVLSGDSAGGNICATIMLRILEHPTRIPKPMSLILAYPALDFNFTSWMSPQNLRVLCTEQSETQIPGLVHGKDHMRHKAPLSVVDDVVVKRKRARQKSWAATISEKLPTRSPKFEGRASAPESPLASGWARTLPRSMSAKLTGWLEKGEQDDEEEKEEEEGQDDSEEEENLWGQVLDGRSDADKSLADRVKTPREESRFTFPRTDSPSPTTKTGKEGLEADNEVDEMVDQKRRKKAPIGTRLTMTSRVGYFQDRVISPTMMRAMAILYVGPRRNPDFRTDYYISPILSPPHLLAQFPPVYLICGERDPFVDDTVIFSGKIREAKRAKKGQAESLRNSGKFGEGLRMSTGKGKGKMDPVSPILNETDEDWVQMRIIEGWGHGFMQMSSLMREVDSVLCEMADWIDESFARAKELQKEVEQPLAIQDATGAATPLDNASQPQIISEGSAAHTRTAAPVHIKPTSGFKPSTSEALGGADLGSAVSRDSSDENDNVVTFTPKSKRKTPPPPSRFFPVPRRPSKESLLDVHRSPSVPKFDMDETGSSGEAMYIRTPPLGSKTLPKLDQVPRGSGTFGLFSAGKTPSPAGIPSRSGRVSPTLFGVPRKGPALAGMGDDAPASRSSNSPSPASVPDKPKNSLVAAAVASARAASPALAAAGLVPQTVGNISEAELMRRRRMEAVYGIGGTTSGTASEGEDE